MDTKPVRSAEALVDSANGNIHRVIKADPNGKEQLQAILM